MGRYSKRSSVADPNLDISAFILAGRAAFYVWQRYSGTPLRQRPDIHRAILTTSTEKERIRIRIL